MKRLIVAFLMIACHSGFSQKIKYKDLFFLLDTKKYDEAEPLLRQYLADEKNQDEANPNLQMAFIYHDKADKTDVIEQTEAFIGYADSAVLYYDRALLLLDEKEVSKKNSEYYQAYQRRDIRTGKFGIKLTDVQFDLENKKKGLVEKKEYVGEMKGYHDETLTSYAEALDVFKKIKAEYPTEKILYLRSGADLQENLTRLTDLAGKALDSYRKFESTLKKVERSGYNPALHMYDIKDYDKDGMLMIDLKEDNIDYYAYDKWATTVREGIKATVEPMRLEMVEFDQKMDDLSSRVRTDSLGMADRIPPLSGLLVKIREYDDDPMPEYLFKYKVADVKDVSYRMDHLHYRDSADVVYQLEVATNKNNYLREKDSLINLLAKRNLLEDERNYEHFIRERYSSLDQLKQYVDEQHQTTANSLSYSNEEIAMLAERARWLINEQDSLPLFLDVNVGLSKYAPLVLTDVYTSGLYFSGESPAEGYFATIDNSRQQNLKVNFKIDNKYFSKQTVAFINPTVVAEDEGHYYYVMFSTQLPEQEQHASTIAKVYASDGLAWANNFLLKAAPKQLIINKNTGDLIVEYDMDNYFGEEEISGRLVITKNGSVK